ncbi:MAG: hypothetical protein AB7V08_13900 [Elusimicrobiales bacterium]
MASIPLNPASRAANSLGQAITAFPDNGIVVTPSDDDHYDTPISVQALAAGAWVPFRVVKVMATDTDIAAGKILGVY